MASGENAIQRFVHAVEQGGLAMWIRRGVVVVAIITVLLLQLFFQFRGLSTAEGMDQAQLARQISQGEGFSTLVIRPLALWQLERRTGELPQGAIPDTINAPLHPLYNATLFTLTPGSWQEPGRDGAFSGFVFQADRIIAAGAILLFFLALVFAYLTARRLFDHRLALIGCGLLLVCNLFWDFAKSGLPQMLMLFLFSLVLYFMVRAMQNQSDGRSSLIWLGATGLVFGLLFLTHGLAIWLFFGALIFSAIYFQARVLTVVILLAAFLIPAAPWLVRNAQVSGNPLGLSAYLAFTEVRGSESEILRSEGELDLTDFGLRGFRGKIQRQGLNQMSNLFAFLGWSVVAPVFFISLLHIFKNPIAGALRWGVLLMWGFAVLGMAIRGIPDDAVSHGQLHVLFIPVMTFYGLAFLLVTWSRLNLNVRFLRIAFVVLLFILCGAPFLLGMIGRGPALNWPPYAPPVITLLNDWTAPDDMVVTDMPWAVAWYADRASLWLPTEVSRMVEISDYRLLGRPVVALFLSPETGHLRFIPDVVRGEYREWFPFIMRAPNLQNFPLTAATPLPPDGEYMLYSDFARWDPEALEMDFEDGRDAVRPEDQEGIRDLGIGRDPGLPGAPSQMPDAGMPGMPGMPDLPGGIYSPPGQEPRDDDNDGPLF